jgi:hypothetical protein
VTGCRALFENPGTPTRDLGIDLGTRRGRIDEIHGQFGKLRRLA